MKYPTSPVVLLVEDEEAIRETLLLALDDFGCRGLPAASGEEAVALIRLQRGRIDWLFTDIRLPGTMNGWRVAEEFRRVNPLGPVIYATASASDRDGMVPDSLFVDKPYRPSQIVQAFRGLCLARPPVGRGGDRVAAATFGLAG